MDGPERMTCSTYAVNFWLVAESTVRTLFWGNQTSQRPSSELGMMLKGENPPPVCLLGRQLPRLVGPVWLLSTSESIQFRPEIFAQAPSDLSPCGVRQASVMRRNPLSVF